MKLVILNGAVCSGKSTIIDRVMRDAKRCFNISYDSLKWHFSGYESGKFYEDIRVLRFAMLRALCGMKYNIITESLHLENRNKHIAIAKEYGYEVLEINIEAEYDTLVRRWHERNASGSRKDIIPRSRFDEIYQVYIKEKSNTTLTFRTDRQTCDEIADYILERMNQSSPINPPA